MFMGWRTNKSQSMEFCHLNPAANPATPPNHPSLLWSLFEGKVRQVLYQIGMFYLFSVFFKIAHLEVFTGMELEEDQQFRMGYAYPISPIEWHTHGKAYFFSFLLHIRKGVEISYWINCVKTTQHSARASSFKAVQGGTSCTILQMAFGGFVSNFWGFFVLKGWNWKRGQL